MDYSLLNQEQLDIVQNGDGNVLVIAGPGSGKTRTLVFRLCHLLEQGTDPANILLLTFTNKAAKEMKNRAEGLIGDKAGKITAGTFHHFANLLIRRHANLAGLKNNFTILDDEDSRALLKQAILEDHESVKRGVVDEVQQVISLSKLKMEPLETILAYPEFFHLQNHAGVISSAAKNYELLKKKKNSVDFDDLLYLAHEILKNSDVRWHYQAQFSHILVDEFQDSDRLQAAIIDMLHGKDGNLMVVGDDSQSIYSFRGAEIRNILEFKEKYTAKIFLLVKNYRSTPPIISLVNTVMSNGKEKLGKQILPVSDGGELPVLLNPIDRAEEANTIANMVEEELKQGKQIGVLFRSAYIAGDLEVDLSRRGIKYDMRGGVRFFEQRHIKDMISLLKAYHNPEDSVSLTRLLALFPRVGEKSIQKFISSIHEPQDIANALVKLDKSGVFSALLSDIYNSNANGAAMLDRFYQGFYRNYLKENFDDAEERLPDIDALIGAASRYATVSEFLDAFSLDVDSPDHAQNHNLVLSTIHQAKGLEWDSVFIIGLVDGVMPHERSFNIEEERRLFYVAASRAKRKLVMSYPSSSGKFYQLNEQRPSRFLLELPENCYKRQF